MSYCVLCCVMLCVQKVEYSIQIGSYCFAWYCSLCHAVLTRQLSEH
jgi:hypothetical protein